MYTDYDDEDEDEAEAESGLTLIVDEKSKKIAKSK
jgi:hypothetical protein